MQLQGIKNSLINKKNYLKLHEYIKGKNKAIILTPLTVKA